jgi:hypothetical protein
MVDRGHRPSPSDLDAAEYRELMGRAALAAQVGPYRRVYGVLKQVQYQSSDSKRLSQNSTNNRVLFVSVSAIGALSVVFNKSDADGVMGQRITFVDNVPGAGVNYYDVVLFPGDELHATASASAVLQVNEQSY